MSVLLTDYYTRSSEERALSSSINLLVESSAFLEYVDAVLLGNIPVIQSWSTGATESRSHGVSESWGHRVTESLSHGVMESGSLRVTESGESRSHGGSLVVTESQSGSCQSRMQYYLSINQSKCHMSVIGRSIKEAVI